MHEESPTPTLVLESLVFWPGEAWTETETSPSNLRGCQQLDWTNEDWSNAVFCGFLQFTDWSELVMVQTGYKLV